MKAIKRMLMLLIISMALISSISSAAEIIEGKVVKVVDGDTIHLLIKDNKAIKIIRLSGIDAPERKQDYGKKAKRYLSEFIGNKEVSVTYSKVDRYGRLIGTIFIDEHFDMNLAMVRAGFAWHYKKYQKEQSIRARLIYAGTEKQARKKQLGLWNKSGPVPPWTWRKYKKENYAKKKKK